MCIRDRTKELRYDNIINTLNSSAQPGGKVVVAKVMEEETHDDGHGHGGDHGHGDNHDDHGSHDDGHAEGSHDEGGHDHDDHKDHDH